MTNRNLPVFALVLGTVLGLSSQRAALAHAFLDHAVPGVSATLSGSPDALQLSFTEAVETALSGVRVTTAAGAAVPTSKPTGANTSTLDVKLAHPLSPGTYVVHWHAVSVDTHRTSGTYKFTVSP